MVVDSNADNLSCLSALLDRFNYQFYRAASAGEALESATVAVPSLIITALGLTDMHGFELMRQLRQNPLTSQVPFIALNSHEDPDVKKRCLELGALGCLSLPLDAETLYRTVQVAVEKNPRSCMRIRTVQPVKVSNMPDDGFYGAYTLDLSERGMFLRTVNPVPVHTRLSLQVDVSGRIIELEATVLYGCQAGGGPYCEPGLGLQIVRIAPKDQQFIRQFIRNEVTRGIAPGNA